jgi:hypothetical protein
MNKIERIYIRTGKYRYRYLVLPAAPQVSDHAGTGTVRKEYNKDCPIARHTVP